MRELLEISDACGLSLTSASSAFFNAGSFHPRPSNDLSSPVLSLFGGDRESPRELSTRPISSSFSSSLVQRGVLCLQIEFRNLREFFDFRSFDCSTFDIRRSIKIKKTRKDTRGKFRYRPAAAELVFLSLSRSFCLSVTYSLSVFYVRKYFGKYLHSCFMSKIALELL